MSLVPSTAAAGRPISIVHVIHHLAIGGMENGLVNLINRLPHERFAHTIVCAEGTSDFARRIERTDVEVLPMHRSRIGVWRLRWELVKLLRQRRPDIVHSRNLSGLDALAPARLCGVHTVHSEHGFDVDNLKGQSRKQALLRRLHVPLVQQYICVSRDLGRLMVANWGVPATRLRHICNGVDTERFRPAGPEREARRALLPEALRQRVVVGTVGRATPIKDQATLLEALAFARRQSPELGARLGVVVVGDGPALATLHERAAALQLGDACWLAGARNDVPALMQAFDAFALPSLNEGISNTILEALATGLPVLATAVGGNPELVDEGVSGALFGPGDVAALGGALLAQAADGGLRRRLGEAARARAEARFSLRAMVQAYAAVYEALSGRSGAAGA